MRLEDFDYTLPEDRIAQQPLPDRAQARLMVIDRRRGTITHDRFVNVGRYLPAGGVLVRNNSRVVPARLLGTKTRSGGRVEIFLLRRRAGVQTYEVLMRPTSKIKDGDEIQFSGSPLRARVLDVSRRLVTFEGDLKNELERIGHMPLPPYIRRPDTAADRAQYQTVYARHRGSVAAPTAGLHFTLPLLAELTAAGQQLLDVTLHVNYGTFKPIEEQDITRHQMHREEYSVSERTLAALAAARRARRPITAVGTTSCRVLESVAATGRRRGQTELFIYPGYTFRWVDALITNFHLPRSSLLMLVYAFGGMDLMRQAYATAIKERYRFYSYGDAMIIC